MLDPFQWLNIETLFAVWFPEWQFFYSGGTHHLYAAWRETNDCYLVVFSDDRNTAWSCLVAQVKQHEASKKEPHDYSKDLL